MAQVAARELADKIVRSLDADLLTQSKIENLIVGVKGVELVRDPSESFLAVKQHKSILRFWSQLPRVQGIPNVVKIAPEEVFSALGYLILIDIDEEADDFRYALYGSRIAAVSGFDMTGKSVWESQTTEAVRTFLVATYMVVRDLRCPLYSVHEAPLAITVSRWHRVLLPLGVEGKISRILVCSVPIHEGQVR